MFIKIIVFWPEPPTTNALYYTRRILCLDHLTYFDGTSVEHAHPHTFPCWPLPASAQTFFPGCPRLWPPRPSFLRHCKITERFQITGATTRLATATTMIMILSAIFHCRSFIPANPWLDWAKIRVKVHPWYTYVYISIYMYIYIYIYIFPALSMKDFQYFLDKSCKTEFPPEAFQIDGICVSTNNSSKVLGRFSPRLILNIFSLKFFWQTPANTVLCCMFGVK